MAEFSVTTYTPDQPLLASDFPTITEVVTIAAGEVLSAGSVLGKVTSSGEYKLSASAATDGSQTPARVLAEDVDASAGATQAVVYRVGHLIASALTFGAGHTADTTRDGLAAKGLYI